MTVIDTTPLAEERIRNLRHANGTRSARRVLHREIRDRPQAEGAADLIRLLEDPPAVLLNLELLALLAWPRHSGERIALRWCQKAGVPIMRHYRTMTVGMLVPAERARLIRVLAAIAGDLECAA